MSAFTDLLADPDKPLQYLVEVTVFEGQDTSFPGVTFAGDGVVGDISPGDAPTLRGGTSNLTTLTYADKYWVGSPSDADKPNADYEYRVAVPLVIERSIPILPEQRRRIERQVGSIEFLNGDGALDDFPTDKAVDGRTVKVLLGPEGGAYNEFNTIAYVLGRSWVPEALTTTLTLRPRSFPLEQPFQNALYSGAGGAEGGTELEDKPKPQLFGEASNITPVLIDPTNLIYQFTSRSGQAVDAVYDQGLALTGSGTDVSGYSNLVSQSVASGEFATALDVGLFKLGTSPSGQITCDAKGDADGGYVNTINDIAQRILTDFGGINSSDIDGASFDGLNQTSDVMGIYIGSDERPSTQAIMNRLIGGVAGFWGAARNGNIRAGELIDPSGETPVLELDEFDILRLEPEESPLPRWRQRVAYNRNWTVQRSDLAGSVTDSRRQFLSDEFRFAAAADTSIRIRHTRAVDPSPILSFFATESAAQSLADRLLPLYKADRQVLTATVKRLSYQLDLGEVVKVTWPRLGLSSGKNFIVVGIREDGDRNEGILRLWG